MEHLRSCHCCGLIQRVPRDLRSVCARCRSSFESWRQRLGGNRVTAAVALAALALYAPAVSLPFLRIQRLGRAYESNIVVGVRTLYAEGHALVASVVLLFSLVCPVVKLVALLMLSQQRWRLPAPHRALTYRLVEHLGRWGMLDVLLVAVMIAFVKLGGLVEFSAGPGLFAFTAFVLLSLSASAAFDPYSLWDEGLLVASDASTPSGPAPSEATLLAASLPRAPAAPPPRWGRWLWLLPGIALLGAAWLIGNSLSQRGRLITIAFRDGHGLVAGDKLRFRGIECGVVEQARLAEDFAGVEFDVRLTPAADGLAREGARFWIVRPQFDLSGAAGLDTVVGPRYLTLLPAAEPSPPATRFIGMEQPPLPDLEEAGGIEVVLQSSQGTGLRHGLGVYYRDVRIGGVLSSALAGDGSAIETRVYIRPQYRHLIRAQSVFFNAGGVHLRGSLTGFSLHIGTSEMLLRGGIGLAVPPDPGPPVADGHRFPLHPHPETEWLDWRPVVPGVAAPTPTVRPVLWPALLRWTHDGFFRDSPRERRGWVLVENQQFSGPRDLLTVPEGALGGTATLTIADETWELTRPEEVPGKGLLVVRPLPPSLLKKLEEDHSRPPVPRARRPETPEDLFLMGGDGSEPIYVAAVRCVPRPEGWTIDPALPIPPTLHGAAALSARDGALLGRLLVTDKEAWIGLSPSEQ